MEGRGGREGEEEGRAEGGEKEGKLKERRVRVRERDYHTFLVCPGYLHRLS